MTNTKSFTKALTFSLLILIGSVTVVRAATFVVTTTADSGPGSLRQAVLDANLATSADTIGFDAGVFGSPQTITLATEIVISPNTQTVDTLTIIGPGANLLTVSGNSVSRIFRTVANDTTSISGMTLTKGAGNNGGAIQNNGIMTLTNMNFVANVTNSGGAIYNGGNGTTGGVLTIRSCTFTGNATTGTNANGDGGSAIESHSGLVNITDSLMTGGTTLGGGGGIRTNGEMNISNSTISNNTSGGAGNSDGGGGINASGKLTLTNCVISGNKAGEGTDGGGIRNEGALTLINTIVTNNMAAGDGGGIYDGATDANIPTFIVLTNSTVSHNVANTGGLTTIRGGGIYAETGTDVTITGSTIHDNKIESGDGGGIWTDGLIKIDRSTISRNTARNFGGVRVPHFFYDTVVTNSTIANNTATVANGGGGFGKEPCNLSCRDISIGNTIISGNVNGDLRSGDPADVDPHDVPIVSLGYNLIHSMTPDTFYTASSTDLPLGTDPKFDVLRDNGGGTPTLAPQPGSPVIDKGKRLSDAPIDQRGVARPTDDPAIPNASGGDGSDIGAYEAGAFNGVAEKTLGNIATRLAVSTGENVLIGGFIIVGQVPKRVIIRAIGPSLGAAGVNGALDDPTLELFQGNTSLAFNNNWQDSQASEISATGVAPGDPREAAIVRTLQPGAYTAIVRGNGNSTGIGLVDGYDLEQRPDSKLGNIATRGFVSTGDNALIGGFIVGQATRVAVRAIGPSLGALGISGPLQDPTLQLVDSNGNVVRTNDNWKGIQQAEIEATGLQPSDNRESTLLATLTAGNYTAVVRGTNNTTGVAVVEVYNLQ